MKIRRALRPGSLQMQTAVYLYILHTCGTRGIQIEPGAPSILLLPRSMQKILQVLQNNNNNTE